jgi:hypothetical protein
MLFISLFSCVSQSFSGKKQLYAHLTDNSKYILLPPEEIEKPMDMAQFISAYFRSSKFYFNAWVKADNTEVEMTLFNELGANMGSLTYKDAFLHFSSPVLPTIQPEYIVADFQLCFYKTAAIRRALENCGLTLETDKTIRRIKQGNDVIIEIELFKDAVIFKNNLRGYSYTIEGWFS